MSGIIFQGRAGYPAFIHSAEAADAWTALNRALASDPAIPCRTVLTPNHWFSTKPSWQDAAVRACRRCPVAYECRRWALTAGEPTGIWGGIQMDRRRAR